MGDEIPVLAWPMGSPDGKARRITRRAGDELMLKIWGRTNSYNLQKVMWCVAELGIEHQRMTWQSATVGRNMRGLIHAMFNPPPEQCDPAGAAPMIEIAAKHWAILDRQLDGRAFVLGAEFTMADIPMGAYALRWFGMDIARPAMPNLEAWYARLRDRDAYRTHVVAPFL